MSAFGCHKPKSLSNKSEVCTVMLDGVCVCVCVVVCGPEPLCSCEDTLNGHSAHINHMPGAYGPLKVIYFTHLLFTEQSSDRTRVYSAVLSTALPVFAGDTALQGEASYSAHHCSLHIAPRTQRPTFCSLCVETLGTSLPPSAAFRQKLN